MILIEATIKYKGYDPNTLSKGSGKRICCSCDECGRVRWIGFKSYKNLCGKCAHADMSGENNPFYGKCHTEENKKKHSECMKDRYNGKNNPNYGNHKLNGKNNPMYGLKGKDHPASQTIGELNPSYGKFGKNSPAWKGGFDWSRPWVLPIKSCIQLNQRFKGSEGHHIMNSVVIFMPKDLHKSICHSFKSGKNMNKINELALQYLEGF